MSINDGKSLRALARSNVQTLRAYESARSQFIGDAELLDANEYPEPWSDDPFSMHRYPEPQPRALRVAMAQNYAVPEQHILITRGADEGIDLLVQAFIEPLQQKLMVCPPTYGMYRVTADTHNTALTEVPLLNPEQNQGVDVEGIKASWSNQHRLLFICSPNNPTGHLEKESDVLELCQWLRDAAHPGLLVIDEAYVEFASKPSMARHLEQHPNLVILRTLSKAWGMAGLRCGATLAHPEVISILRSIQAPYPIPSPTAALAAQTLSAHASKLAERVETIHRWRSQWIEALSEHPQVVHIYPSQTNFILVEVKDAQRCLSLAREAGIILRDQTKVRANHLRITIDTPKNLRDLLEAWKVS